MKKSLCLITCLISLLCNTAFANPYIGVDMGALNPQDKIIRTAFDRNLLLNFYFGIPTPVGLDFKANLGFYGDTSNKDAYIGLDYKLGLTMLSASFIYNFAPQSVFNPYAGLGLGAYFYNLQDNVVGEIETGTVFGTQLILGAKLNISDSVFIDTKIEQHMVEPVFYNNSDNFNSSVISIGMGFSIPDAPSRPAQKTVYVQPATPQKVVVIEQDTYRYTEQQEILLVQIQQARAEINEMKSLRAQYDKEISAFYRKDFDDLDAWEFKDEYDQNRYKEKKLKQLDEDISIAQSELNDLMDEWNRLYNDNITVQQHIIYLEKNYHHSHYGLIYTRGYFQYKARPHTYRYYRAERYKGRPQQINRNDNNNNSGNKEDKKKYIRDEKNKGRSDNEQQNIQQIENDNNQQDIKTDYLKKKEHILKLKNQQ